jgi:hypothetical protein
MRSLPRSTAPLLPALTLALAACGGAAEAPAQSPKAGPSDESAQPAKDVTVSGPATVEEAQLLIARAREELGGAPGADAAPRDKPAPAPAPPPRTEPSPAPPKTADEDRCASSCRALGSMRRAVDALCRMTGDDDARCTDARKTLRESTTRVAACRCP